MDAKMEFQNSVVREAMLLHKFLADVYSFYWIKGDSYLEVIYPEVDNSGYDVIITVNDKTKYIQLKGLQTTKPGYNVNSRLRFKKESCVVLIKYSLANDCLSTEYSFYEIKNDDFEVFPFAKHTKPNADGKKAIRENIKRVPQKVFSNFMSVNDLLKKIF